MEQHGGADADRRAIDRSNQRLAGVADGLEEDVYRAVGTAAFVLDEIGNVVTAGETLGTALDDDGADAGIVLRGVDGLAHDAIHVTGQGILLVGAVQRQG